MANSSKILNQQESDQDSDSVITYRECWRNHAVLIGGYAADGCGEFIPKGSRGTKEGLLCEACGCHRNFHRKEVVKNGVRVVGSHHLPPPNPICPHNNEVVEVCVSSDPFYCYCYKAEENFLVSVSDEESVICSSGYQTGTKPTKEV